MPLQPSVLFPVLRVFRAGDSMEGQDLAWATIAAVFAGPIAAVIMTRLIDWKRARDQRRLDVFRTLMRTRRTPTYPEHVGALNLVEIEFYGVPSVIDPFKALLKHFGTEHTRHPNEQTDGVEDADERRIRDERFDTRIVNERSRLLAVLLHAMARKLKFNKIQQMEIFEGGYTPQAWANIELEQSVIRRYLVDLYLGNRVVPVGIVDLSRNQEDSRGNRGNSA